MADTTPENTVIDLGTYKALEAALKTALKERSVLDGDPMNNTLSQLLDTTRDKIDRDQRFNNARGKYSSDPERTLPTLASLDEVISALARPDSDVSTRLGSLTRPDIEHKLLPALQKAREAVFPDQQTTIER